MSAVPSARGSHCAIVVKQVSCLSFNTICCMSLVAGIDLHNFYDLRQILLE
jgi:hypothetical protein